MRSNKEVSVAYKIKPVNKSDPCSSDLLNYILYPLENKGIFNLQYPSKPARYFTYGINSFHQHCYNSDEIQLINNINANYIKSAHHSDKPYFATDLQEALYGYWTCVTPSLEGFKNGVSSNSFTLPESKAKDEVIFPLWSFSDSVARRIANKQSIRVKNQLDLRLLNDPGMLVLEELKDWFYNSLSNTECHEENLDIISQKTSYVKNIMYMLPEFGPDKLFLHDIQESLNEASSKLRNCISSKSLPHLLSDVIINGKNVENIIASYLHFILINEEVSDNFSSSLLNDLKYNCQLSPVCKIFNSIKSDGLSFPGNLYSQHIVLDAISEKIISVDLNPHHLSRINFATFINEDQKLLYLKAFSLLDSFSNIRMILEEVQGLQSNLGIYSFSYNFVDKVNLLSSNSIELINKANEVMNSLFVTANAGLQTVMRNPKTRENNIHFINNMRSLETKIAGGTTLQKQFTHYTANLNSALMLYQSQMKKIVQDINSGSAIKKINHDVHRVDDKIKNINLYLPAIIRGEILHIQEKDDAVINPNIEEHGADYSQTSLRYINDNILEICSPIISESNESKNKSLFDYGKWDEIPSYDRISGKPIFKYRTYFDNKEVGSIEFYATPMLCFSEDLKRHNVLNPQGIFQHIEINPDNEISQICDVLPPSIFDKIIYSSKQSAINGALRGVSKLVGIELKAKNHSNMSAYFYSQLAYASSYFSYRLADNLLKSPDEIFSPNTLINNILISAAETGSIVLSNFVFSQLSNMFTKFSLKLEQNNWSTASQLSKAASYFSSFGFFFHQSYNHGFTETLSGTVAGIASENLILFAGEKILH